MALLHRKDTLSHHGIHTGESAPHARVGLRISSNRRSRRAFWRPAGSNGATAIDVVIENRVDSPPRAAKVPRAPRSASPPAREPIHAASAKLFERVVPWGRREAMDPRVSAGMLARLGVT